MSLINCEECNAQISNTASSCVNCGAPTSGENISVGTELHTIQMTAKKFKAQKIISISLSVIGFILLEKYPGVGTICVVIGLVWYVVNRLRIWWHHK